MAAKPENTMLQRILKYLHARGRVVGEKTNNPYRAGIWDVYLEAQGSMAWMEAKYWKKNVEVGDYIEAGKVLKRLTPKQRHWGLQRAQHSIPLTIICGFPKARHVLFFPNVGHLSADPETLKMQLEVHPTDYVVRVIEEYLTAVRLFDPERDDYPRMH